MERWNPFRDNFGMMRQRMDRWLDDRGWLNQPDNVLSVAIDLRETGHGYELEASLPGIRAEDIEISIEQDTLTLRGQSISRNQERSDQNYIYRERRLGAFMRTLRLPELIDTDHVEASLDHGILRVQLPRLVQSQYRRVPIHSQTTGSREVFPVKSESPTSAAESIAQELSETPPEG